MASPRLAFVGAVTLLVIAGCRLTPAAQEVGLPGQDLSAPVDGGGVSQLVVFNDSNKLLYGLDGSGRIKVEADGKEVGQLKIGEYLVLAMNRGPHEITLEHWDLLRFSSTHDVAVDGERVFLKIRAKMTSNEAISVDRPADFSEKFRAAHQKLASLAP